ncbi:MAG: phosphate ABC transporter permease PstA [Methylobacteriaceae bacterium]|nr:phosphate ABC transporter permease PstA [Methylobacteriaceae bacterium]
MTDAIAPRYGRRRRTDKVMLGLCWAATAFGLGWLVLILFSLIWNGASGLDLAVFMEMTPPAGSTGGGLLNAIVGSLIITAIGVAIGAPLGMLAGTYMAEYGRYSKLASVTRFINDILLSAPSIIIGLFIYGAVVVPMHGATGIAGGIALAVIVVPVVVRTTEDMLLLVPNPLREAASALGLPRSHVIIKVAYKAARAGLITGVLLAVARISGETAPLLFTSANSPYWSVDPFHDAMANLPVTINNFVNNPDPNWRRLAWAAALIITFAVLVLNIVARVLGATRAPK